MIYIPRDDFELLRLLAAKQPKNAGHPSLRDELVHATVLPRDLLPAGVVVLNSRVRFLDVDSGEEEEYILTLPQHADADTRRLSILSPIGTALIGYREGDEVTWPTPGGERRLRVLSVSPVSGATAAPVVGSYLNRLLYGAGHAAGRVRA